MLLLQLLAKQGRNTDHEHPRHMDYEASTVLTPYMQCTIYYYQ